MAGETQLANFVTIGNAISEVMSPAFVSSTVMLNLISIEQFPDNTNVIKFRKGGSVSAAALAESTAGTYQTYADSSVTVTGAKVAAHQKISVEALRFGAGQAGLERIGDLQGQGVARKFDTDACALFDAFSQTETATNVLTRDELMDARTLIESGDTPMDAPLVAVLHPKQVGDIRKELSNDSATPWSNLSLLQLLDGSPRPNAFMGNLGGIEIYASSLVPNDASDHSGAVFHPIWALCAGVSGSFETEIDPDIDTLERKIASYLFYDVKEYNDAAGVTVISDM